ncbi:MAG: universal stress protein [Prolixibacteraceae bacterium]
MKKVLIALDYNPSAQKVAETGYLLAKAMKAEVVLLHVITDSGYYSAVTHGSIMGFPGYMDPGLTNVTQPEILRKKSFDFLDQTKKHLKDETIESEVIEGYAAAGILKIAKKINADLVVIGSHSKRWLEKILVGSVTEEVLRDSTIPLFIIPIKEE